MKIFDYKGRDLDGKSVKGRIFSTTEHAAAKRLISEDVTPISIKKTAFYTELAFNLRPLVLKFCYVEKQDLIRFCKEMSLLVKSGVSVRQSIANLSKSMKGKIFSHILKIVVTRLDSGYTLAESFSGFPNVFPTLFVAFLSYADYAEYTSMVFAQLGETLQARKDIKKEMIEAMIPFTSSLAMIILAGYILSQVVMPEIIAIYAEKGRDLPIYTRLLADFFDFIENSLIYILGYSLLSFLLVKLIVMQFEVSRYYWDKCMLQLPVYKRIRVMFAKMDFSRAIAMSLSNGYPIQKVLDISSSVVLDRFFRHQIITSVKKIAEGEDLIKSIRSMELFTYSELEILEVGREAENLEESFNNVVAFNRNELSHRAFLLKEGLNITMLIIMVFMICFYMVGFYLGYLYLSF
ncbi:MAG: type II secretion system F family protein [Pseudomonadota bacterium]|nr:type II secretion system F family protein [Pseudomonadota bacterium]